VIRFQGFIIVINMIVIHVDSYLDELEWRYNNRENPYLFRDTLLKLIKAENLPYEKLTSH
jgi:hypothetical protein